MDKDEKIASQLLKSGLVKLPPIENNVAKAGVISPAEAKTWREWADKAPALLRVRAEEDFGKQAAEDGKITSPFVYPAVGLGAVAAIASFTKFVPGKWKWLSGAGAALGLGGGFLIKRKMDEMNTYLAQKIVQAKGEFLQYADTLEREPRLRQHLADYLGQTMTGEAIANRSIEDAVAEKATEFLAKMMFESMADVVETKRTADRLLVSSPSR